MRCLTSEEARAWCQVQLDERGLSVSPSVERHSARRPIPQEVTRLTWFCRHLERALQPRKACLLWATAWGIWGSSENLHLYYTLRRAYGDLRLLHEAPAHLFLDYEAVDLVSFLEVGILCGWDLHLLPAAGYTRAFVSHDEFVEFASDANNPERVGEFVAGLGGIAHAR